MSTVQNQIAQVNPEQRLFNEIEIGLKARYGFSQWNLSTIYIFLAFWIKTILLKLTDKQINKQKKSHEKINGGNRDRPDLSGGSQNAAGQESHIGNDSG